MTLYLGNVIRALNDTKSDLHTIISYNSQTSEGGTVIIPTSQMRKLKPREKGLPLVWRMPWYATQFPPFIPPVTSDGSWLRPPLGTGLGRKEMPPPSSHSFLRDICKQ